MEYYKKMGWHKQMEEDVETVKIRIRQNLHLA
jgi:hypothetical protein